MTERIAVIGMGQMGSAMAGRLSGSQYDVMGYDINQTVRRNLSNQGVKMADSLGAALVGRTTVLTSLPDPDAVEAAWLGEDGIVALAEAGSLLVELSTIDPDTMKAVGGRATARATRSLIAPSAAARTRPARASWCCWWAARRRCLNAPGLCSMCWDRPGSIPERSAPPRW